MPLFRYTTIDGAGNKVEETLEAADERSAAAALRSQKKFITGLNEVTESAEEAGDAFSFLDHLSPVSTNDLAIFFRQLSSLLVSGITLLNSLHILKEQEKNRRMRKIIGRICLDVERGAPFSTPLKKFPKLFDHLTVGMVEAGEASGMMTTLLEKIATSLEQKATFKNQMTSAAIYPAIVIIAVILLVVFLVGIVIPKIVPILKLRGSRLPWNTQFLIDISEWFKVYWRHLFGCGGIFLSLVYFGYKSVGLFRYWIDRLKPKLPVVGPVFFYATVAQFTRNLSILLESGLTILVSLRIVHGLIGNEVARKVIRNAEERVSKGEAFSTPIKDAPNVFPLMVASMVAVGEETGRMDSSLGIAADIHEKILQTYITRMTALIEPLLIIVLGAVVGFVAWSLISGIFSMYQT